MLIGFLGKGYITFSFCYVTARDRMVKGTYGLVCGRSLPCFTTLPSLVVVGLVQVDITSLIFHVIQHEKKLAHGFNSLKITFSNCTKDRMTHFYIFVAVNVTEKIMTIITNLVNFESIT